MEQEQQELRQNRRVIQADDEVLIDGMPDFDEKEMPKYHLMRNESFGKNQERTALEYNSVKDVNQFQSSKSMPLDPKPQAGVYQSLTMIGNRDDKEDDEFTLSSTMVNNVTRSHTQRSLQDSSKSFVLTQIAIESKLLKMVKQTEKTIQLQKEILDDQGCSEEQEINQLEEQLDKRLENLRFEVEREDREHKNTIWWLKLYALLILCLVFAMVLWMHGSKVFCLFDKEMCNPKVHSLLQKTWRYIPDRQQQV